MAFAKELYVLPKLVNAVTIEISIRCFVIGIIYRNDYTRLGIFTLFSRQWIGGLYIGHIFGTTDINT
jgi:hypothetical protein